MISIILITKNSEKTLEGCLSSVRDLASEIILVDGKSIDGTVEIARNFEAKIFVQEMEGFGKQKQFALEQAECEWVFLIDSDEMASSELVSEIREIISSQSSVFSAYRVRRKNTHFGKWLKHGGKYPDFQTRLFKRELCRFSDDIVHEKIMTDGQIGTLQNPLIHHSYPDIETWTRKLEMFSSYRGEELYSKGIRPSLFNFFRYCFYRPCWRFARRFIFKLGFLDGMEGFLACIHDLLTEIFGYYALSQKIKK